MSSFEKDLAAIEKAIEKAAHNTLVKAGELGVKEAQETSLFHHGNKFEEGIKFIPQSEYSGEVISEAEYSEYLEFGNDDGSGRIKAKNGKALHFWMNGEEVFVNSVKAHGPLPFVANAADIVEQQIANIFDEEIEKLLR
jgi:hypothetical protein